MTIRMTRRSAATGLVVLGAAALGVPLVAVTPAVAQQEVEVWKSPSCGCCSGWVRHMQSAGFSVKVHDVDDVQPMKDMAGVPDQYASCHTARVGGYTVEGHVPASDIRRLLAERPKARGLSVPGMPADAPGMDMRSGEPYAVVLFGAEGGDRVYARY